MEVLNGKALSQIIKEEIRQEVELLNEKNRRSPHLAAVLVGENPAESGLRAQQKCAPVRKSGFARH